MSLSPNQGYSLQEVARKLRLSERQVYEALRSGHLRTEKTKDGRIIILPSVLKEYQARHHIAEDAVVERARISRAEIDKAKVKRAKF